MTLNLSLFAFLCEGLKIGLLFVSSPCTGEDFWETEDPDEVESYHSADQCWIGRGCYLSISALCIYFCVTVYVVLAMVFYDYSHDHDSERFQYDDISMPSFLHSIGASTLSSKNSGAISATGRSNFSGSTPSSNTTPTA